MTPPVPAPLPPAALQDALRLTRSGRVREATAAIQRAVGSDGAPDPVPDVGGLRAGTCVTEHGTRSYLVHVPAAAAGSPRPLLVLLHGGTQTARDAAVGTRTRQAADRYGWLVAYPEQDPRADPMRYWHWFRPDDCQRGSGEAALLVELARQVAREHGGDLRRVHVAGFSAGGAMAAAVGAAYPDVVAGVGVHSGLPGGAAYDVPSALAAMRGERPRVPNGSPAPGSVPSFVVHGDADGVVAPVNADRVREAAVGRSPGRVTTSTHRVPGGRAWTRRVARRADGSVACEQWTVHGADHAWSGGDPGGSYVDPAGPDAADGLLAFFTGAAR